MLEKGAYGFMTVAGCGDANASRLCRLAEVVMDAIDVDGEK